MKCIGLIALGIDQSINLSYLQVYTSDHPVTSTNLRHVDVIVVLHAHICNLGFLHLLHSAK